MNFILRLSMILFCIFTMTSVSLAANYHVLVNDAQQGPISMEQLQEMTNTGVVTKDTLVWKNGMAQWQKASEQQDLQKLFAGAVPPPPPPPVTVAIPPSSPPVTPPSVQSVALSDNSITKNDVNAVAKEAPPQPSSLQPGDDLRGMIAEYAINLQIFFDTEGASYTVSYGVAPMQKTDKSTIGYINSMNLAYKDALLRAYVSMASPINPNGRDVTTEDGVKQQDSQGDAILDNLKQSCTEEANLKYQQYLAKKERQRREKEGKENSLLGIIKKKLKSDGDAEVASSQPAEEKPEPDFIYECTGDGNVYVQSSATTNGISDTLSGGRVWASMLHEGMIGVVLVKSNDTSEVASVLKNQMEPSAPLKGAFAEVATKIKGEVANFPDIPLGLVGTRMMKLSNGEWALYSFGAAQVSSGGAQGFMDRAKKGAASSSATNASLAELSRFSGLMVDQSTGEKAINSGQSKLTVEINVTQGTATYKTDTSSTLGKVLEESYSGSSNLKLIGAQQVYFKKFTDGPLSFYLSAQAWSPSIMAANMAKRKGYDSSAENAVRNGKYQTPGAKSSSAPNDTGSESRVILMNQDW